MAGHVVGVVVGLEDVLDAHAEVAGEAQVLVDVQPRVDHRGDAGLLVADQVRARSRGRRGSPGGRSRADAIATRKAVRMSSTRQKRIPTHQTRVMFAAVEAIRIETDGLPPDTGVLVLDGELSIGTGVRIPLAVDEQLRDARTRLVIDLSAVEFIDSSGLSLLLNAQRRIQRAGGALRRRQPARARPPRLRDDAPRSRVQALRHARRGARLARRSAARDARQRRHGLAPPARQHGRRAVRGQRRRQLDLAVLALAVLEQRDQRAPDGDGGAVERVQRPRACRPAARARTLSRRAW